MVTSMAESAPRMSLFDLAVASHPENDATTRAMLVARVPEIERERVSGLVSEFQREIASFDT